MSDPVIDSLLGAYPRARIFLLARTKSAEEAARILEATVAHLEKPVGNKLSKEVIDFFRLKPTGKTWWDNLVNLMDFVSMVKNERTGISGVDA